jgi:hypothetical protein
MMCAPAPSMGSENCHPQRCQSGRFAVPIWPLVGVLEHLMGVCFTGGGYVCAGGWVRLCRWGYVLVVGSRVRRSPMLSASTVCIFEKRPPTSGGSPMVFEPALMRHTGWFSVFPKPVNDLAHIFADRLRPGARRKTRAFTPLWRLLGTVRGQGPGHCRHFTEWIRLIRIGPHPHPHANAPVEPLAHLAERTQCSSMKSVIVLIDHVARPERLASRRRQARSARHKADCLFRLGFVAPAGSA